jgi:hypothetical protein
MKVEEGQLEVTRHWMLGQRRICLVFVLKNMNESIGKIRIRAKV